MGLFNKNKDNIKDGKVVIISSVIFIILVIVVLVGIILYGKATNYSNILKANWNIEFPENAKIDEVYSSDSESSFHGDGIRYHIFSYEEETSIEDMFDWTNEEHSTLFYSSYNECVNNWLEQINVSKENFPKFSNCKFWYRKKDDNSEIIILLDDIENKLYVVESFI